MTVYSVALFVHVVGAVLLFAALTVEGVAIRQSLAGLLQINRVIGPISALAVLVPGLFMMATVWGARPWITAGLASWVLIAVVGTATGIRITRSGRTEGRLLATSWWARTGLALGVLFLMTVKPGVLGSLVAVVGAALLGAALSAPAWIGGRSMKEAA